MPAAGQAYALLGRAIVFLSAIFLLINVLIIFKIIKVPNIGQVDSEQDLPETSGVIITYLPTIDKFSDVELVYILLLNYSRKPLTSATSYS